MRNANWVMLTFSVALIAVGMYLMATGFVDFDAQPTDAGEIKSAQQSPMTPGMLGLLMMAGGVFSLVLAFRR